MPYPAQQNSRYSSPRSVDPDAGMTRLRYGSKTNYLRDRSSQQSVDYSKAKTYAYADIGDAISKMAKYQIKLAPIGKTAEVWRELYFSCNVMQFFDLSGCETARNFRSNRIIRAASQHTSLDHEFNEFQNRGGRGVITPFGMIYTELTNFDGVQDYVSDQDFDKIGLLPIRGNNRWWKESGFYDSEMKKDNHYETIVDFVVKIGGSNEDVVATGALLNFAEKKDTPSLEFLMAKLAHVSNAQVYQEFVEEIKSVAKL